MTAEAPNSIDVTDYQFKLHDKLTIFGASNGFRNDINLLATASPFGLVFLGNQSQPELKVIQLQRYIDAKETGEPVLVRSVTLPGIPHNIAVSCDGSLLAVNFTQNGAALLAFYSVPSFLSANIISNVVIRIASEDNVQALQILWNPVMAATVALVLSDGSLGVYNLKETAYEFYSIDRNEQVKCASWSPKGKQIVVGFPHGKLMQYKPDLKPARTIACPPNVQEGPFNTIAIQWLSTYQFAVVFLTQGENMSPCLYIVNAPKTGNPTYINYYDICYSSTGPRVAQIFLTYVQPWNILLVACSNSMEVGVLGTTDSGDMPVWKQYIAPDEARIELPLTVDKQETYPIGFAFETGCTHQLVVAEKLIPVMPMIHILSTHGQLVSFDFLNFSANAPDLCSPPRPASDTSGLAYYQTVFSDGCANHQAAVRKAAAEESAAPKPPVDVSFSLPKGATSTPAMDRKPNPPENTVGPAFASLPTSKPAAAGSLFGQTIGQKPTSAIPFGGAKPFAAPPAFGQSTNVEQSKEIPRPIQFGTAKETSAPVAQTKPVNFATVESKQAATTVGPDKTKPLYTVQPTYAAPQPKLADKEKSQRSADSDFTAEDGDTIKQITRTYIQQFEADLKDLSKRSKDIDVTIGNMDEFKEVVRRLNDLDGLSNEAVESTESLVADLQSLRNTLNECFVMLAETKSKLNMLQNPDLPELATLSNASQTNRRQIIKLKSLLATNEAQLQIVNQQIDAQWSNFQDIFKKSKTKMRIPSLEGVYQTLLKQKDILSRERQKINYIRSRLGIKGAMEQIAAKRNEVTIESLADSILSMSLSEQVRSDRANLTDDKLKNLREILANRRILEIKPQRPERVGVKSEVVREMRIKMTNRREGASTKPEKMEKQRIKPEPSQQIAKPTPTKPSVVQSSKGVPEKPQPVQLKATPASSTAPLPFAPNIIKPTATTQSNNAFAAMAANLSLGNALQKIPSSTSILPFGGAKPGAPLSFGAMLPPATTASLLTTSKNEPLPVKPTAASGPLKPEVTIKTIPFQPKPDKPTVSFEMLPSASDQPAIPFASKPESSPAAFKPPVSTQPPAEPKAEQTEKPDGGKQTASPFAVLNFGQSTTGVGGGFSFGTAGTANSTVGSIFGGQVTTAKPTPSIFGTAGQSIASTPSQLASTPALAFSTPPSAGFTPLSVAAAIQSNTASSTASSFSFLPKDTTSDSAKPTASVASSFSFVSKPEAGTTFAESVASIASQAEQLPSVAASSVGSTPTSPTMQQFSFAAFSKNIGAPTTTVASATDANQPSPAVTTSADPTDSLFNNLNICKPTVAPTSFNGSPFGGNAFTTLIQAPNTKSGNEETTSSASTFAAIATITSSAAPLNLTATSAPAQAFSTATSTAFISPASSAQVQTVTATPSTPSVFGQPPASGVVTTATPAFGQAAASSPPAFGALVSTPAATPPTSTFGTTPSPFSTVATNAFAGGIPKPDQSVFAVATSAVAPPTSSSPFAAQPTTNVFGSSPTAQSASGENLFGTQTGGTGPVGFGLQASSGPGSSIFGGSSPPQQSSSPFGGATTSPSIFGGGQKTESSNIFANATQPTQTSGTGFFVGSLFGDGGGGAQQPQSSIFGGGGNTSPIQPSGFSTTGFSQSPFGGATQQQQPQQNLAFGGAGSTFGNASAGGSFSSGGGGPAFGQSTGFGAPSSPGGSFAQVGQPSVAQTGFGSPGAFGKPAFGAQMAFGGVPTFGGSPTFGGGATFGSPKSAFGSFAQPTAASFSPPEQKNNLFEALGSTETGLSFGNLAQTGNSTNAAKQQFGGSSFSNWR